MSYKACPSYFYSTYCPYGSSCPFMHVPLQKTCLNFSQTNYCKYFPNCKYLHFDYAFSYVPQARDSFQSPKDSHFRKQLKQSITMGQTNPNEILYNINFSKDHSNHFFYDETLRRYLLELSEENFVNCDQIKSLNLNLNSNFVEKFSIAFSVLHNYVHKTENLKISLTNVYINDAFLIDMIGLLNKIKDLNTLHLSFQNCVLEKETYKEELLSLLADKIKFVREFRFTINYDYSAQNNEDYQIILSHILEKLLKGNTIVKLELLLGLSNFEFMKAIQSIKVDEEPIIFKKLEAFSISLSNLPDRNQILALGNFLNKLIKVKSLCINFLNHDKQQLTNAKTNERLIFDLKMAENLKSLRLLKDLQFLSIVFEEKIYKEAHAFDLMLSYFSQLKTLNFLELEGSNMVPEFRSQNLLMIIDNNQNILEKLSLKLSYNRMEKSFFQFLLAKIQNLKKLSYLALDFEFSKINNSSLIKFVSCFQGLSILKSLILNLSKNRISEEGCQNLGKAINKLSSLDSIFIDLSFNTILDFGLKEIIAQIPRNIHHLMIMVERNGISSEGIKIIKPLMEENFSNLRKVYFDFLSNESIGKEGNVALMEMFEKINKNNVMMIDGSWESDFLENGDVERRLSQRIETFKEFLRKKKVLAYQMKKMKEKLRKCFRKDLRTEIAVELLLNKEKK